MSQPKINPERRPAARMPLRACPHAQELRVVLARGQWPQAAPAELRTHVAGCRACSDLALLTGAFHAERAAAAAQAQLPPPSLLWWRAQLHRRNQALERISRPLAGAQLFALLSVSLTLVAFALFLRRDSTPSAGSAAAASASHLFSIFDSSHLRSSAAEWLSLSWSPAYLLPAIALLVLAGGLAVYMTSERG